MGVFWGLYHQRQTADAQRAAGRAETRVTELRAQMRLVEDKLESLPRQQNSWVKYRLFAS